MKHLCCLELSKRLVGLYENSLLGCIYLNSIYICITQKHFYLYRSSHFVNFELKILTKLKSQTQPEWTKPFHFEGNPSMVKETLLWLRKPCCGEENPALVKEIWNIKYGHDQNKRTAIPDARVKAPLVMYRNIRSMNSRLWMIR